VIVTFAMPSSLIYPFKPSLASGPTLLIVDLK